MIADSGPARQVTTRTEGCSRTLSVTMCTSYRGMTMLGMRRWPPAVAAVLLATALLVTAGRWAPGEDAKTEMGHATTTTTTTPVSQVPSSIDRSDTSSSPPPQPTTPTLPPLELLPAEPLATQPETFRGRPVVENAEGIVVHQRLAPFIRTLLADAEVAGIALEGSGYRDIAAQRRLRATNCPDPVNSPAEECSPPTALPGTSFHESGLAIDFTSNGDLITSRDHPAYLWLDANAEWIGLRVHPEEPWHWSYRP